MSETPQHKSRETRAIPGHPGLAALAITHGSCMDHVDDGELFELSAAEASAFNDEVYCPVDAGCAVIPLHVSVQPATDDTRVNQAAYHYGRQQYEYELEN